MVKCPKCKAEVTKLAKDWKYGVFTVKMYKCLCGNEFREYFREGDLRFMLSAHNGGIGRRKKIKK